LAARGVAIPPKPTTPCIVKAAHAFQQKGWGGQKVPMPDHFYQKQLGGRAMKGIANVTFAKSFWKAKVAANE